jgi:hypothetical protein
MVKKPGLEVESHILKDAIDWDKLEKNEDKVQRAISDAIHTATIGVLRSQGLLKEKDSKVFESKCVTIKPVGKAPAKTAAKADKPKTTRDK